jgi:hypothetical protein
MSSEECKPTIEILDESLSQLNEINSPAIPELKIPLSLRYGGGVTPFGGCVVIVPTSSITLTSSVEAKVKLECQA